MTNNCKITFIDDSTQLLTWKDGEGNNLSYDTPNGIVAYQDGFGNSYTYWPWAQIKKATWGVD